MYSVTKVIQFCYGHRLLNYSGKCRFLHGHNGTVEIELSSARLDRRGMVRDFTEIKRAIQTWIDSELDHKMLLNRKDPALAILRRLGEPVFVMDANPTAEAIAELIFHQVASQGFPVTAVRLWETDRSVATYRREAAARTPRRSPARTERRNRPARPQPAFVDRRGGRSISTAA